MNEAFRVGITADNFAAVLDSLDKGLNRFGKHQQFVIGDRDRLTR